MGSHCTRDSDGAVLMVLLCPGFLCFSKLWSAALPRHPLLHFLRAFADHFPPQLLLLHTGDYLCVIAEGKLRHMAVEHVV